MRVISGYLKGRKLEGYNLIGTRPTMDKVKESMFAMIQDYLFDKICLDLYAGSGSLGIEAISEGSKFSYFVDNNKNVIDVLNKNIKTLKIESKTKVILNDSFKALDYFYKSNIKFDVIFLDPPYDLNIIEKLVNKILDSNILNDKAIVVCEYKDDILSDEYRQLKLIKTRDYKSKKINIYVYNKK